MLLRNIQIQVGCILYGDFCHHFNGKPFSCPYHPFKYAIISLFPGGLPLDQLTRYVKKEIDDHRIEQDEGKKDQNR